MFPCQKSVNLCMSCCSCTSAICTQIQDALPPPCALRVQCVGSKFCHNLGHQNIWCCISTLCVCFCVMGLLDKGSVIEDKYLVLQLWGWFNLRVCSVLISSEMICSHDQSLKKLQPVSSWNILMFCPIGLLLCMISIHCHCFSYVCCLMKSLKRAFTHSTLHKIYFCIGKLSVLDLHQGTILYVCHIMENSECQ